MSDIDEALDALGKSWRDAQPPPTTINVESFRSSQPRSSLMWLIAAAIVPTVLIGVVAIRTGGEPASGAPETVQPSLAFGGPIAVGDLVAGSGVIIGEGGEYHLCRPLVRDVIGSEAPTCDKEAVRVVGPVGQLVSTWLEKDGVSFTNPVTIFGHWTEDGLMAERVEGIADSPSAPSPSTPDACSQAVRSWAQIESGSPTDHEVSLHRLREFIDQNPEVYAGSWRAHAGYSPSQLDADPSGVIVATTGDLDIAREQVRAIYAGNLCVVRVAHSLGELERQAALLRAGGLRTEIDVTRNGLRVSLPILDHSAWTRLTEVDVPIVLDALVRRA